MAYIVHGGVSHAAMDRRPGWKVLERFLDTTGLLCPLPVLKARRALREMSPGEEVEVHATDPGAERDFADLCAATGDRLVEFRQDGGTLVFRIRKRS